MKTDRKLRQSLQHFYPDEAKIVKHTTQAFLGVFVSAQACIDLVMVGYGSLWVLH